MKKSEKIGPRFPGGAFTKGRVAETKLGPCTVKRRVQVRTQRWVRKNYGGLPHRFAEIHVDCGEGQESFLTARAYRGIHNAAYAADYGFSPKKRIWLIGEVDTVMSAQRQGLATRAYEALAAYICQRNGVLISHARLEGAHSNDFWLKQIRKGRARVVGPRPKDGDFTHAVVALDCHKAKDLSGGLGSLNTRTSRTVLAAYRAGYRVDGRGQVVAPTGRLRKTQTKGSAHGPYRYRTFSMKDGDHVVAVPVAHLAAVQKYGKKALRAGVEVRHLNDRSTDDRPRNIAIGSRHTNIMDTPKSKRVRIAKAGARAATRARKKLK